MAHRGRLNVLANVMEKSLQARSSPRSRTTTPSCYLGRGDVKYHLGYSTDRMTPDGQHDPPHARVQPEPPRVREPGRRGPRARQAGPARRHASARSVMPLLIHGDAAFIGQGVVAETLNLARLEGYTTGGTIHVVVNNQIGFTTRPAGRALDPLLHRHRAHAALPGLPRERRGSRGGRAGRAARDRVPPALRQGRRHRHVLLPPLRPQRGRRAALHAAGDVRGRSTRSRRCARSTSSACVERGNITEEQAEEIEPSAASACSTQALEDDAKGEHFVPPSYAMRRRVGGYNGGADASVARGRHDACRASACVDLLDEALASCPPDFNVAPQGRSACSSSAASARDGEQPFDWGTGRDARLRVARSTEGTRVRLTGQDARRGTFSHRHAVLYDDVDRRAATRRSRTSRASQARFEVYDSPLSEAGVLGFEYGYSLDYPDALVIWEAQFGDFANGAQVIIDQFIVSSEDKWHRLSGLVLLLPHGFEGQGPEHSSARLERFLQLVRRGQHPGLQPDDAGAALPRAAPPGAAAVAQAARSSCRPRACCVTRRRSRTLDDLATGEFQRVIPDDATSTPKKVKRVLLCTRQGLLRPRSPRAASSSATTSRSSASSSSTRCSDELIRERPRPVHGRHAARLGPGGAVEHGRLVLHERAPAGAARGAACRCSCVSRPESASPATGSMGAHKIEQARVIEGASGSMRAELSPLCGTVSRPAAGGPPSRGARGPATPARLHLRLLCAISLAAPVCQSTRSLQGPWARDSR